MLKMPWVDLRDFGAALDGTTDDSAPLLTAWNAVKATGAQILIDGPILTSALTLSGSSAYVTVVFRGLWNLIDTLTISGPSALIGEPSGHAAAFQNKPCASMYAPFIVGHPGISIPAPGAVYLADLSVQGGLDAQVSVGGHANNVTLDNCGLTSGNHANSVPLKVDSAIWFRLRHSALNVMNGTGKAAMWMTNTVPGIGSGLIYIDDVDIAGKGFLWDAPTVPSQPQGNLHMRNVVYETGRNEFFTFDGPNGGYQGISMDKVEIADAIDVPTLIKVTGTGGPLKRIALRNVVSTMPYFNVGANVQGAIVENTGLSTQKAGLGGPSERDFTIQDTGILNAQNLGQPSLLGLQAIPWTPLPDVVTDPARWIADSPNATVTTGIVGPDGSRMAGKLTSSAGLAYRRAISGERTLVLGDWVVVGVWIKAESDTPPVAATALGVGNGWKFDVSASSGSNTVQPRNDFIFWPANQQWIPAIGAGKLVVAGTNTAPFNFVLGVHSTAPASFFMPFVLHIPASAGISDAEIVRWKRTLMTFPPGTKPGYAALWPHQGLYFGGKHITYAVAAPTTGTWAVGDITYNTAPTAGGTIGWVCTASGTPGTWKTFGAIAA
jgi:hypothetical protein